MFVDNGGLVVKLSDYVFKFIADLGVDHVFMVVGGANSHLADSVGKNQNLRYVCAQHEQAAAMAAEGYARASGKIGVALVTSGPGSTNALTGVCGAWCDSVPCVFISGQVASNLTTDGRTIRQLGVQQINIIDIVRPVTKFAVMVTEPKLIRYHLEEAVFKAKNDRPGPVWIDIPADIQRVQVEPDELVSFRQNLHKETCLDENLKKLMLQVVTMLKTAQRPILIAGYGIRLAGAQDEFLKLVRKLDFPVVTTWNGIDLIDHGHPLYVGSAGVMGQRGANFAIANSDLILSIGSRMDTRQVGNSPETYAREAKKIVVDVDDNELAKGLIKIDLPIKADAKLFIELLLSRIECFPINVEWEKRCREWKEKYPIVLPEFRVLPKDVNSYVFVETLCSLLGNNDLVVTDMGTSFTCTMQTFHVRGGQRLFTNSGFASMGFGLPATIGAWFGRSNKNLKRVIGIYGDGGFQMNIQELQTVVYYQIPVKMFLLNNKSYLTIKHTQEMFFEGNLVGSDSASGYSAPDFGKVADAYGIYSLSVDNQKDLTEAIRKTLNTPGPVLCEIIMPSDQLLIPISVLDKSRGHAGSPIERMYPFLSEEEFLENMIIDPI